MLPLPPLRTGHDSAKSPSFTVSTPPLEFAVETDKNGSQKFVAFF
jgi:hypothetical protein